MRDLTRLGTLSVGLKVIRFVLGIGSSALLARLMTVHDYGVFGYALVVAAIFAIPGEAGMPNLVMREIARAREDGDVPRVRGIIGFANATVLGLTLTMAASAALVLWAFADRIPRELSLALLAAFPALLLGSLANTRAGIQRGLGSAIASQLPEQVVRPAALILFTLVGWQFATQSLSAVSGLIAYALASATAFALGAMLLRRTYATMIGPGPATYETRRWLAALIPFSINAGLQVAMVYVSTFLLGLLAPPGEVATFRIASLTSDFILFSVFAINALVAPQFAAHFHRSEFAELQRLVARANGLNMIFALAVTASLLALGPWGLALAFGEPYRAAYPPMCILAFGNLLAAGMGYAATLANMAGRERLTVAAAAPGLVLNTALSLLLCAAYGAVGAAIAAAVTAVIWRLILSIQLFRFRNIRAWAIKFEAAPLAPWMVRPRRKT